MNTRSIRIDRYIYIYICFILPNNLVTYAIPFLSVIFYMYLYIYTYIRYNNTSTHSFIIIVNIICAYAQLTNFNCKTAEHRSHFIRHIYTILAR